MTDTIGRDPVSQQHLISEEDPALLEAELLARCHHEAAHAVFAHYDGMDVREVRVSLAGSTCEISRGDIYERHMPWRHALCCVAGAYAAYVRVALEHPKPEHVTHLRLQEDALRVPKGDAWWALEMLGVVVGAEDSVFDGFEEAYAFLMIKVGRLIEERQAQIEALAFALHDRYLESGEEKLGRLDGAQGVRTIDSAAKEGEDA